MGGFFFRLSGLVCLVGLGALFGFQPTHDGYINMRPSDGGIYRCVTVIDKNRVGNGISNDLDVMMIILHTPTIRLRHVLVPQSFEDISWFSKEYSGCG